MAAFPGDGTEISFSIGSAMLVFVFSNEGKEE